MLRKLLVAKLLHVSICIFLSVCVEVTSIKFAGSSQCWLVWSDILVDMSVNRLVDILAKLL